MVRLVLSVGCVFFSAGLLGVFHFEFFSNQSNAILLFGGNKSWFTFVSHPLLWRSDASLYVTHASFMRIKRQHTHVLKGAPVVVYCNHGHSDTNDKLAESEISSVELDQVRMYTSISGCSQI